MTPIRSGCGPAADAAPESASASAAARSGPLLRAAAQACHAQRSSRDADPRLLLTAGSGALRRAEGNTRAHRLLLHGGRGATELAGNLCRWRAGTGECLECLHLAGAPAGAIVRRTFCHGSNSVLRGIGVGDHTPQTLQRRTSLTICNMLEAIATPARA